MAGRDSLAVSFGTCGREEPFSWGGGLQGKWGEDLGAGGPVSFSQGFAGTRNPASGVEFARFLPKGMEHAICSRWV